MKKWSCILFPRSMWEKNREKWDNSTMRHQHKLPVQQLSKCPCKWCGSNNPLLPACRQKLRHLSCNLLKNMTLCSANTGWMPRARSLHPPPRNHARISSFSSCIAFPWPQTSPWGLLWMIYSGHGKSHAEPRPPSQQLLAVWGSTGYQRVLLGPSLADGKLKSRKVPFCIPSPLFLCVVCTCACAHQLSKQNK